MTEIKPPAKFKFPKDWEFHYSLLYGEHHVIAQGGGELISIEHRDINLIWTMLNAAKKYLEKTM